MEELTEKQWEVLDSIQELLREHFDASVVVVDAADVGDACDHVTIGQCHGGPAAAMGLCLYQLKYLEKAVFKE